MVYAVHPNSIPVTRNLKKSIPININSSKEDYKITLVEEIEELGFIPSLEKNNDSNAA